MENIRHAVERFVKGEMVVVLDDNNRENEADIIVPIDKLTPEKIDFLARKGRGLICAALSEKTVMDKGLLYMPGNRNDRHETAFLLSVDSRKVSTGISPYDRYLTAKDLADPSTSMRDFISPGHLFPLCAKPGGVLQRRGHTEAAIDLCRLAGIHESALICEITGDDGLMVSEKNANDFAELNGLANCSIDEIVECVKIDYPVVRKIQSAKLATQYGMFDITIYEELWNNREHVFLSTGDYQNGVVRIHSECMTGDVFSSRYCDCGVQLKNSFERISKDKKGAIVYLRQEGRGIGLGEKIKAYNLQQTLGCDTVDANLKLGHKADGRDYHQAAWILKDQGFKTVRLMTDNPQKISSIERHGLKVKRENMPASVCPENYNYLLTKKNRFGHLLDI